MEAEPTEPVRVLEPEEAPHDEVDAAIREALRNHELVVGLFDEAPRLTHETQQETPRATITVYKAETVTRELRLRVLWTMEADGVKLNGIDVQHREGAAFQRQWNAGA